MKTLSQALMAALWLVWLGYWILAARGARATPWR